MTWISSVNASGSDLSQLLKDFASEDRKQVAQPMVSRPAFGPSSKDMESRFGEALKATGVSDDEAAQIQDEIKSAISSNGENGDNRINRDVIKSSIDSVLEKHGLDPEKIHEQLRPAGAPPKGGHPQGSADAGALGAQMLTMLQQDSQSNEDILQKLLSSGTLDSSTAQMLQSFLPSLDATA